MERLTRIGEFRHSKTIKELADLVRKTLLEQEIVRLIGTITDGRVSVDLLTQLESSWDELGLASIDVVDLVMAVEDAFHIRALHFGNIHNIQQLVSFVREHAKQLA